jgi:small subunit ribosomal protein S11
VRRKKGKKKMAKQTTSSSGKSGSTGGKAAAKKRVVKVEAIGEAHVNATFNNIIITLTNMQGQTISWSSAGKMGFRGSKKNTPYAAQTAASDCGKVAFDAGLRKVKVYVKGPGAGRESAIRTLNQAGIEIIEIVDITPIPHNGCRPPKRRRV